MIKKNPKDTKDPDLFRRTIDSKEKAVIWNDAVMCTIEQFKSWVGSKGRVLNTIYGCLEMDIDEFEREDNPPPPGEKAE